MDQYFFGLHAADMKFPGTYTRYIYLIARPYPVQSNQNGNSTRSPREKSAKREIMNYPVITQNYTRSM